MDDKRANELLWIALGKATEKDLVEPLNDDERKELESYKREIEEARSKGEKVAWYIPYD